MIRSFGNKLTEDLFHGHVSKEVRKFPAPLKASALRKLTLIEAMTNIQVLAIPPGNQLEKKQGDLKDYWSIRINQQWRIVFQWDGVDAHDVQITDYH